MNTEKKLYQWDTEQKLTGCTGLYVDFPIDNEVYRVETANGMCIIPDELLQTSGSHKVYECMTNNTIRSFAFSVIPRPKPPDYVFTPTERLTFEGLVQKVDDAVADMIRRAESGEFDGHTPIKGTDYFTASEIQQIQNEVSSGAIGEFKTVVDTETETFNNNAESKLSEYNTNASNKVTEYNSNAENKTAEFDSHTEQIQADVNELKSDLSKEASEIDNLNITIFGHKGKTSLQWEIGRIASNGALFDDTTTCRTQGYHKFDVGDIVGLTDVENAKYRIYFYESEGSTSCVQAEPMSSYWHTKEYTFDETHANYYCKFLMAKSDDSVITDLENLTSVLYIEPQKIENNIIDTIAKTEQTISKMSDKIVIEAKADFMSSGDILVVAEDMNIKKNCVQEFYADITSFDSVTVGHGQDIFMGSFVTVTNTEVILYYRNLSTATVTKRASHGLTISDFINVILENDDKTNVKATITTASGVYVFTSLGYHGCRGSVFATSTSSLTNCVCKYIPKDLKKDIYLFGDSYTALGDNTRFTSQLVNMGFADNIMMSGYSGATSVNEIKSFRNIVALMTPKYVVWALGMNDGDTDTAINKTWKTYYDEVNAWCETNDVELILVTIPNVPSVNNTYKNAFIKASGHRYIDFAKSVGAEEKGSNWYANMLSTDNVHPAELGGKVLASRFLLDLPECIY